MIGEPKLVTFKVTKKDFPELLVLRMGTTLSSNNGDSKTIHTFQMGKHLISNLKSKGMEKCFVSNVEKLLSTFDGQLISIKTMSSIYLKNINKKTSIRYIIPLEIISLVSNYVGTSMMNLPRLSTENLSGNKCNVNAIYNGELSMSHINSTCDMHGRIIGKLSIDILSCKTKSIILDVGGDLHLNWAQLYCAQGGNIFIRCNKLTMDNISRIRTIDQWIEMQPTESMKKEQESGFGSVTLIVKKELIIQKSSIYTGFSYIRCESLQMDRTSAIVSSDHKAIIYVSDERFSLNKKTRQVV